MSTVLVGEFLPNTMSSSQTGTGGTAPCAAENATENSASCAKSCIRLQGIPFAKVLQRDQQNYSDSKGPDTLVDARIVCKDGCIPLHRFILMAASPLLRNLLVDEDPEALVVIHMPDIDVNTLRQVLALMYSGTVHCTKTDLKQIKDVFKMLTIQLNFGKRSAQETDCCLSCDILSFDYIRESETCDAVGSGGKSATANVEFMTSSTERRSMDLENFEMIVGVTAPITEDKYEMPASDFPEVTLNDILDIEENDEGPLDLSIHDSSLEEKDKNSPSSLNTSFQLLNSSGERSLLNACTEILPSLKIELNELDSKSAQSRSEETGSVCLLKAHTISTKLFQERSGVVSFSKVSGSLSSAESLSDVADSSNVTSLDETNNTVANQIHNQKFSFSQQSEGDLTQVLEASENANGITITSTPKETKIEKRAEKRKKRWNSPWSTPLQKSKRRQQPTDNNNKSEKVKEKTLDKLPYSTNVSESTFQKILNKVPDSINVCDSTYLRELKKVLQRCHDCRLNHSNRKSVARCLRNRNLRYCWVCLQAINCTDCNLLQHIRQEHSLADSDSVLCKVCNETISCAHIHSHIGKMHNVQDKVNETEDSEVDKRPQRCKVSPIAIIKNGNIPKFPVTQKAKKSTEDDKSSENPDVDLQPIPEVKNTGWPRTTCNGGKGIKIGGKGIKIKSTSSEKKNISKVVAPPVVKRSRRSAAEAASKMITTYVEEDMKPWKQSDLDRLRKKNKWSLRTTNPNLNSGVDIQGAIKRIKVESSGSSDT